MSRQRAPVTPAIRALRSLGIEYSEYLYSYDQYPGALGAASFIGIDPHLTAKTIVFATSDDDGVIVLMHGDLEVSTKKLARIHGVKTTRPAGQDDAKRWTGYQFGGTSPFGLRTEMVVYVQSGIANLSRVYVNAGAKGFVVGMDPSDLIRAVGPALVDVATSPNG